VLSASAEAPRVQDQTGWYGPGWLWQGAYIRGLLAIGELHAYVQGLIVWQALKGRSRVAELGLDPEFESRRECPYGGDRYRDRFGPGQHQGTGRDGKGKLPGRWIPGDALWRRSVKNYVLRRARSWPRRYRPSACSVSVPADGNQHCQTMRTNAQ
jgi:hypothetical protein